MAAIATLPLAGCVTKAKARQQARDAFLAGQQQAMTQMRTQQQPPQVIRPVTFIGQFHAPSVPWTPELTLAAGIVSAGYSGPDPTEILIIRNNRAMPVDPKKLLGGADIPLQAGDLVQVK